MKKNKHPKKKAKLFYSVFFQGETISKKKKLIKLCRVNFEVRAPYPINLNSHLYKPLCV